MHTAVRRAIHTALLTGGLVVAGSVAAHAAEDDGLLAGLGIQAPVDVPVEVSGLAAGLLGDATVTGAGGAPADPAPAPTASVPGGSAGGAVSGTEVAAPVHVPVDVSAVAVGVLGDAAVAGSGTPAPAAAPSATVEQGDGEGLASGTAVAVPVGVPVTVDSVALGVLGDAAVTGTGPDDGTAPASDAPAATVGGGDSAGIASGTGAAAPISIPVTVGSLAVGLLGDSAIAGSSGTAADAPAATVGAGSGEGLLARLGLAVPVSVPVTLGGLALGVGGDATVADPGTGTTTPGTTPGTGTTPDGTATPASAVTSAVLAAADVAAALDASAAAGVRLAPAALAPTGAPAAVLSLTAAALVALGLLLRRLPRTAL
ncbi:hypothetical protein CHO01_28030 [Cellulomonas hominis]|uniref:Chaplin domain-containing protein n=1 Tax=Cellulomonas hominis TaxID=156981 RepID=A0A511FH76_9CELL|nr:chaplin family protein [Cellulomonas hominis]MBB5473043.1 hypothetical protein [Cellulomonas hominis]GEL47687.1 hypothetical protein CHO01_28030 [Cellulomonas hominis]